MAFVWKMNLNFKLFVALSLACVNKLIAVYDISDEDKCWWTFSKNVVD